MSKLIQIGDRFTSNGRVWEVVKISPTAKVLTCVSLTIDDLRTPINTHAKFSWYENTGKYVRMGNFIESLDGLVI